MAETFRQASPVKPERGDLWVASTLITDQRLRLGLSRLWLLSPQLEIKAEIPTGRFGMVSGLAIEPASGVLFAFDPTARSVAMVGHDGALLPEIALAPGRGLGSGIFLSDGDLIAGEHFCGVEPPFHGDGRLLRFDRRKRLKRLLKPKVHGGVAGFLGLTHMALMADQRTFAYVSETGDTIYRYDLEREAQLDPLYVRDDPPAMVFGIAAAPKDFVIVMCGAEARCINTMGEVARRYALPEGRGWSFIRLSRDGVSFWCGDFFAGALARIDLATGEVLAHKRFEAPFSLTSIVEAV